MAGLSEQEYYGWIVGSDISHMFDFRSDRVNFEFGRFVVRWWLVTFAVGVLEIWEVVGVVIWGCLWQLGFGLSRCDVF